MHCKTALALGLFAVLSAGTVACKPPLIPGTQVNDTPDARAVLEVLSRYKVSFEALDANAVIDLAAPGYFDKGDPGKGASPRDLDGLRKGLADDYKKIKAVKMDVTVKDVRVQGDRAEIDYYVVLHYMLQLPAQGGKFPWKDEQDDAQFALVRVGGAWKVQSGL